VFESGEWLQRYGVVILPGLMVAEQFGVPAPAVPALLWVGALAARGRVSVPLVLSVMVVVGLAVDFMWYELGRRRGAIVLAAWLRRLSREPDASMQWTRRAFARYGLSVLLLAKFVPGLTTITPPLAGMLAVPRGRFARYDAAGVVLWAGTWLGLGYVFSDEISLVARRVASLGDILVVLVAIPLAGYVAVRAMRRRRSPAARAADRARGDPASGRDHERLPTIGHPGTPTGGGGDRLTDSRRRRESLALTRR
jgi:membrane protein DedA with SNARE-associated domain